MAGTSRYIPGILKTLVKHLFLDSRGKVAQELIGKQYLSQR